MKFSIITYIVALLATAFTARAGSCDAITSQATCMSSSEGSEACAWCSSGAVGTSCQKQSDAESLPAAVFECDYQTAYAAYSSAAPQKKSDKDCSQCTGDGPCAPCASCVDMKDGPCAPCWSSDNAAGEACLPTCESCYSSSLHSFYFASKAPKNLARPSKKAIKAVVKDGDCSQCTGDGPCAACASCVDMKDGPCAPCWSSDNAAGEACLPTCESCFAKTLKDLARPSTKAVKAATCDAISDESTCMESSEGSEACAWCSSGAVGTSCQTQSDAESLPAAVFECNYQTAYAAYAKSSTLKDVKDGDCSQCTGDGPCAACASCVDMKDGPCAPCWSSDNAAGEACLPTCESCYSASASYAPYATTDYVKAPQTPPVKVVESNETSIKH